MSKTSSPRREAAKRSSALLATGLVVTALALGGAASAQASSASLTSSPATATAGGSVLLDAQGFTPGDALSFELDGTALSTSPLVGKDESADANGDYSGDALIPEDATLGTHTISVTDASSSDVASTTITVVAQPTASVTPSTVALADYLADGVTVTYSGFTPGETVGFAIGDAASGIRISPDAVADAAGSVTVHWVPQAGGSYSTEGTYEVIAASTDLSIVAQRVSFTVTADAASDATTAPAAASAGTPLATAATPVARAVSFTG
ncbi:hypothetical protein ACFZA2_08030 [Microbacterium sp. NPDC007973]|uniref:hypothetical protein n=1 Tax=Microbacterium sp. NPDC007973 TaxID=3364182 RepID=UPI0036E7ED37